MYKTVTLSDFHAAFKAAGRGDQFTREGRERLFEYLEGLEEDMGEPIELDVIALCCDYTESTLAEAADAYNIDIAEDEDEEEFTGEDKVEEPELSDDAIEKIRDYMEGCTGVVYCDDNNILYANF